MKSFILLALFIFSLTFSVSAQNTADKTVSPQNAEAILRVEADGKTTEFKKSDLAKLPRREVKAKTHDGKETTFGGVDLREVLKLAGVKFGEEGKKTNLTSYLIVEAADNYRAVFAMLELEPNFTDKVIILADTNEGKTLRKDKGNWQLIVPDEKKQARWVRQVVKLIVGSVDSKITSNAAANDSSDEDAIREIVFKKILERWQTPADNRLKAYYLAVDDDKDPGENLLKKIVGNYKIPIKKVSESFTSAKDGDIILNKITKEPGVLFSVSKVNWKNKDEATVSAGSYIGNMGSDGCQYTLKKENGEWKIVGASECYVS